MKKSSIFIILALISSLLLGCEVLGDFNESQKVPEHLKVIEYNVWNGFANPLAYKSRTQEDYQYSTTNATDWLKSEQPDIVIFTEFNKVTPTKFKELANVYGHSNFTILKPVGYPTAVSSKYPIKVIEKKISQPFHHGFLHVKTAGIHVYAIHLAPNDNQPALDKRMAEAKYLSQEIKTLIDNGESVIIAGDFNAETFSDKEWYESENYKNETRKKGNWCNKNAEVLKTFLSVGLHDAYAEVRPEGEFKNSCDSQYKAPYRTRIDYILISPDLMKKITDAGNKGGATVFENDAKTPIDFSRISDHFPTGIWF